MEIVHTKDCLKYLPSKLGVAGLSPVFRSHFKALTMVGAFFVLGGFNGFYPHHVSRDVSKNRNIN